VKKKTKATIIDGDDEWNAFLLQPDDPWVVALDQLDRFGDKDPLVALLRSECDITPTIRSYIADLIERGIDKPGTRPRIPTYYKMSITLQILEHAVQAVHEYIASGMLEEVALENVAVDWYIDLSTLRLAFRGKHSALTRSKKRSPS
jgi:hypothetical protein